MRGGSGVGKVGHRVRPRDAADQTAVGAGVAHGPGGWNGKGTGPRGRIMQRAPFKSGHDRAKARHVLQERQFAHSVGRQVDDAAVEEAIGAGADADLACLREPRNVRPERAWVDGHASA